MKQQKNSRVLQRFTLAQIVGIACGSAALIGAVGFLMYQTLSPTSYIHQVKHDRIESDADFVLTDTQVRKLSDQVVKDSIEVLSTDVLADFINQAVDATLDKTTIETAINDVLASGDVSLTDAQKNEIAAQVRQNVEASWLALTTENGGFSEDQLSYLITLISNEISKYLSDQSITNMSDYSVSPDDIQESIITAVLERLFPDNPEIADGYASPGRILTEEDLAKLLGGLDASSLQELLKQIRSKNGSALESEADAISGNTVWAKLGTLWKKVRKNTDNITKTNTAVAEEALSRAALKEDIDANIKSVNDAITKLQKALNSYKDPEIAAIKAQLEQAISALNTTLSANISSVSKETKDSISTIQMQITALQSLLASSNTNSNNNYESLNNSLQSAKDSLNEDLAALDLSLRADLAALAGKIESSAPTDLEKTGEAIGGTTVIGKLGNLFVKMTALGDSLSGSISDETRARESAAKTLQNNINSQVKDINAAMQKLQDALSESNDSNADAIVSAKAELKHALDTLDETLSGNIDQLDSETRGKISSLNGTISDLKSALEGTDEEIRAALSTAKQSLADQIASLDASLTDLVNAERDARIASEAALQAQIKSESNTGLEKIASEEITGVTVFGKLGSLYKSIGAVKQTEGWAQDITLNNTSESGTKIYGIQDSTDPNHAGWKMWRIDGASLGLDFRAEKSDCPESEVKINYLKNPVIIRDYGDVEDGFIVIYTPSIPDVPISIRSIHVTNKLVE